MFPSKSTLIHYSITGSVGKWTNKKDTYGFKERIWNEALEYIGVPVVTSICVGFHPLG
jgi:hypothetical protein